MIKYPVLQIPSDKRLWIDMTWMTYKGNIDYFKNFNGFDSLFVKLLEIFYNLKKEKN